MTEVATRRPAHEVILEAIGANVGDNVSSEFVIRAPSCAAEAVLMLCDVVQNTNFPEKHLAEMITELKRIKETDSLGGLQSPIEEAIRDLESRQGDVEDHPQSADPPGV